MFSFSRAFQRWLKADDSKRGRRRRGALLPRRRTRTAGFETLEGRLQLSAITQLLKNINTAPGDFSPLGSTARVGNTVFFTAHDATHGAELWKTAGDGVALVRDIRPEGDSSNPSNLTGVGATLFFTAFDDARGWELWKSNGTAAGTVLVRDLLPGAISSGPQRLTNVGGVLYFTANDDEHGEELWKSDGTAAGTVLVRDIFPGYASASPTQLTDVAG
jgi:ELWxxDGT repeat protein